MTKVFVFLLFLILFTKGKVRIGEIWGRLQVDEKTARAEGINRFFKITILIPKRCLKLTRNEVGGKWGTHLGHGHSVLSWTKDGDLQRQNQKGQDQCIQPWDHHHQPNNNHSCTLGRMIWKHGLVVPACFLETPLNACGFCTWNFFPASWTDV